MFQNLEFMKKHKKVTFTHAEKTILTTNIEMFMKSVEEELKKYDINTFKILQKNIEIRNQKLILCQLKLMRSWIEYNNIIFISFIVKNLIKLFFTIKTSII
ncbi:hypothetical protein ALC152_19910 [Arcobacter sp. 15-2]